MFKLVQYLNIVDMNLLFIAQICQIFKRLFHSIPKHQQVTDETGRFVLKEMFSLVCRIQFRQASNADIQEAVDLLHDIEEKFPNGTYHPEFEYRKGVILQAAAKMQQQEMPPKTQEGSGPSTSS